MRYIIFVIFIASLSLTTFAQNVFGTAPFAYIYPTETGVLNLVLMDAASGETIFAYDNGDDYCLFGFAPNRDFFIYSINSQENYLFRLDEDTWPVALPSGLLRSFVASATGNLLALQYDNYSSKTLLVYETRREKVLFSTEILNGASNLSIGFEGTDLLFAYVPPSGDTIEFHRQSLYRHEAKTFPFTPTGEWHALNLSPDGNYLSHLDSTQLTVINTNDGSSFVVEEADSVQWLPNQDATLAYLTELASGEVQLIKHDLYAENDAAIDIAYPLLFAPESNYALYNIPNAAGEYQFFLNDLNTEETIDLDFTVFDRLDWLSPSQFVFASVSPDGDNDLYLYDITSSEKRQLTDTAAIDERLNCGVG